MGKKVIGTCDYPAGCEETGAMTAVSIMAGNRSWEGDLCTEHLSVFQMFLSQRRKKTDRERVWTMEEIEALKGD